MTPQERTLAIGMRTYTVLAIKTARDLPVGGLNGRSNAEASGAGGMVEA